MQRLDFPVGLVFLSGRLSYRAVAVSSLCVSLILSAPESHCVYTGSMVQTLSVATFALDHNRMLCCAAGL